MRLPVRTDDMTMIAASHEPAVKSRQTGELVVDPSTGQTVFIVHVTVIRAGDARPELWGIRVAGEPKGLTPGGKVTVSNLEANVWTMDDGRHGVTVRADALVAAGSAVSKAA